MAIETNVMNLRYAESWDELDRGLKECIGSIQQNVILAGLWIIKMRETEQWREHFDTLEDYFTGPVDAGGLGFGSYQTPTRWARVAKRYVIDLECSLADVGRAEHTKLDLLASRATSSSVREILLESQPTSLGGLSVSALKTKYFGAKPTSVNDGGLGQPVRIWRWDNAPQKFKDRMPKPKTNARDNVFIQFTPHDMQHMHISGTVGKGPPVQVTEGEIVSFYCV
tara:strand:- start:11303 stop:11977 length:675 start_codon:yes stop_codon:yes gene_type:complete